MEHWVIVIAPADQLGDVYGLCQPYADRDGTNDTLEEFAFTWKVSLLHCMVLTKFILTYQVSSALGILLVKKGFDIWETVMKPTMQWSPEHQKILNLIGIPRIVVIRELVGTSSNFY